MNIIIGMVIFLFFGCINVAVADGLDCRVLPSNIGNTILTWIPAAGPGGTWCISSKNTSTCRVLVRLEQPKYSHYAVEIKNHKDESVLEEPNLISLKELFQWFNNAKVIKAFADC